MSISQLKFAARESGEKFFDCPIPCRRGHVGKRYASTGGCVACVTHRSLKPLTETQLAVARRYVFSTAVPLGMADHDVDMLETYLTRCMEHYCKAKGQEPPYDMGAVAWSEQQNKPLHEARRGRQR